MASYSGVRQDVGLFGSHHQDTVEYLRSSFTESSSRWSARARQKFKDTRERAFESIDFDVFKRRTRAAGRFLRSKLRQDSFRPLHDIVDLQHPPAEMLNYLAANPVIRNAHQRNQCDGWSDRYKDDQPGAIKEDHYWYRRATNGVFIANDDNKSSTSHIYLDRPINEGDTLDFEEQMDINHAWRLLELHYSQGEEDPTSKFNSKL